MSKAIVTLNFPDLIDFVTYLKEQGIHRYGLVTISEIHTGEKGTGFYTESLRFTAINRAKGELIKCDIAYYRSVFITEQHHKKEAKAPRKKLLNAVQDDIKKWTEGYELKMLHCQFEK